MLFLLLTKMDITGLQVKYKKFLNVFKMDIDSCSDSIVRILKLQHQWKTYLFQTPLTLPTLIAIFELNPHKVAI